MNQKQLLIIDDDQRVLHYLRQGLVGLGDEYSIDVAKSGSEALSYIQEMQPALVLSDLRMPDIDGLELVKLAKAMHPETKFILMTAYGTEDIQHKATELGVYRFMTKPFRIDNLLSIIHAALSDEQEIKMDSNGVLVIPDACLVECQEVLQKLRSELRPELALMGDMAGYVVTHVGTTMGLDLNSIIALVAGNFATASELDRIFDRAKFTEMDESDADSKPMYITYLEGRNYDCYSANVGSSLFFTVIFNRQDHKNKAGMVWLHMRRTFHALRTIIQSYSDQMHRAALTNDKETVTSQFQEIFKENLN